MSAQHTTGPWAIEFGAAQDGEGHVIHDGTDQGYPDRIAVVLFHDDHEGETRANASLIAAAPDLLAALQYLVRSAEWQFGPKAPHQLSGLGRALRNSKKAITKATGVPA